MKEERRQKGSMGSYWKVLLYVLLPILLLDIVVGLLATVALEREIAVQISTVTQLQADSMYTGLQHISQTMQRLLVENTAAYEAAQNGDPLARVNARSALIDACAYPAGQMEYEAELLFCFPESGLLLAGHHAADIPISRREGVYAALLSAMAPQGEKTLLGRGWSMLEADGRCYAARGFYEQGVWVVGCISAESLLAPLAAVYPATQAFPVMLLPDGTLAAGAASLQAAGLDETAAESGGAVWVGLRRWLAIDGADTGQGFAIRFFVSGYGPYNQLALLLGIFMALILLTACALGFSTLYTRRRLLRPLQQFVSGVRSAPGGEAIAQLQPSQLAELEEANEQFRGLMNEVRRLKINIYESELEHGKMQLDYMQQQIKPHFLLNCLSIIYSMANNGQNQEVARLSQITSHYLRYVFHSEDVFLPLAQEVEHIGNYMEIIGIRYSGQCRWEASIEEGAGQRLLPPLLLHSFVENAVKHGTQSGHKLLVNLSAIYEEDELVIFITDNGRGFPAGHLALWEEGGMLPREDGAHVGIANAVRRLRYAYGPRARVRLYNSPQGGAVVEIHLPAEDRPETEEAL